MEAPTQPPSPRDHRFDWLEGIRCRDRDRVAQDLSSIWNCGGSAELLENLRVQLTEQFEKLDNPDEAIGHLQQFVTSSSDSAALLELFQRDDVALPGLLQMFGASQTLSAALISEPDDFPSIAASGGQPAPRRYLVETLAEELSQIEQRAAAANAIRKFHSREILRAVYGEFVRGLSPEKVGRYLASVADAVVEAALGYVVRCAAQRRGMPQRPDGTTPELTVIGLGNLGGEEMSYSSPLKLVFVYDSIDRKNIWHHDFYHKVVDDLVSLLRSDHSRALGIDVDLREGPRHEVGVHICSYREAIRIYETAGRTWQRLSFVKARVVAGSQSLGEALLGRLEPWVYRQYLSRVDLAEIRTLRHKLEKRAEQPGLGQDISRSPGGRGDLELTVQFLQLLHGGRLPEVRCRNTYDAIRALQRAGCLTHQEATLLAENYARLSRLQHQLSVMLDRAGSVLPLDDEFLKRLAWQLGIRSTDDASGDLERFQKLLGETFAKNRKMINHLMLDPSSDDDSVAVETELLLDPDPDPSLVESTMRGHGLTDATRAMQDLASLSTENVTYLSPHRCRHFFSSIAPALLKQVSRTPDPDAALSSLVKVTDSLGAKATLWELLGNSRPTMELMVRLCATTPYLSGILTNNPGMIDELIDSLLMNRLPSAERLDAHSIELCRGAADIELILHSFKNSAHLMIGVRDMLGKESLEATHQAIGDTAEACLRRMIEHEQEELADRYGDPVDQDGNPTELLTLGLGKLGGREPNYHSDLDAIFLYSADGDTKRRVGGHRAILTNQQFFNELAQNVIARINHSGPGAAPSDTETGRLYELDSRLRDTGEEGVWAMTIDEFLERFRQDTAPLWQRLALCKARSISGSRALRQRTDAAIAQVIVDTNWQPSMAAEIRELRDRMQQTARPENLKRGEGGTVDVEFVAQMMTLRHAGQSPDIIRCGTTASISALAEAGFLEEERSLTLINGYRTLRRIEANLRLMNTSARHELPEDADSMKNLAFLMNESDPAMIEAQCQGARQNIRAVFNHVFDEAAS